MVTGILADANIQGHDSTRRQRGVDSGFVAYMICYMALSAATRLPAPREGRNSSSRFTPLERPDRVAQVLEQLREQIMVGAFGADGVLPPEGTLAVDLGVSRTVVREAMRMLRSQGLVEVSQGKPPRVKPADPQAAIDSLGLLLRRSQGTLLHLVEARRPLESEIAALAAERATPEHLTRLAASIEQLTSARTLAERIEADVQFHRILAESTGNPVFCLVLETVSGPLHQSRRRTIAQSGVEVAAKGHREVLAAIRRRDGRAARAAMLDHLTLAERDLRASGELFSTAANGKKSKVATAPQPRKTSKKPRTTRMGADQE